MDPLVSLDRLVHRVDALAGRFATHTTERPPCWPCFIGEMTLALAPAILRADMLRARAQVWAGPEDRAALDALRQSLARVAALVAALADASGSSEENQRFEVCADH